MDNNQPADISDEQLLAALKKAIADFPPRHSENKALNVMESLALELRKARAVAALAREGWQPIRSDALSVAEGEVVELVAWLRHEAESQHPGSGEALPSDMCDELLNASTRLTRAAELLLQQAPAHVPALPPRPPVTKPHHANTVLTRWGLQWNGQEKPIAVPMDDGYWTPWHVADELLRQALVIKPAPVRARERPWERERWLHPRGLWCWQWRPDSASWQMTTCGFSFAPSDDSLLLPYWAIIDPDSSEAS